MSEMEKNKVNLLSFSFSSRLPRAQTEISAKIQRKKAWQSRALYIWIIEHVHQMALAIRRLGDKERVTYPNTRNVRVGLKLPLAEISETRHDTSIRSILEYKRTVDWRSCSLARILDLE